MSTVKNQFMNLNFLNMKFVLGFAYLAIISIGLYFLFSFIEVKDLMSYEFIRTNKDTILKFKNRENPIKTAAFVFDDLAKKHYFVDGNKRTAYIFTKILLINQGFHLSLNYKNSVDFILKIARYKNPKTKREIESWIKKYIKRINEKEIDKYLKEIYYDLTHGEENDKER